MLEKLQNKEGKICLIGLGYVGLPIALEFAKKYKVIGYDINQDRIDLMRNGIDPSKELGASDFQNRDIYFTSDIEEIRDCTFYIVAVPTPIDDHKSPNLKPLLGATSTVAKVLKRGDYVVFESTVYPGCTEEECVPILESISGLTYKEDFKVGYSPERINPGDKEHTLTRILKVVSGCDKEASLVVADVYDSIITAGIHQAATIKVAEAAKVIENTQRDVNIALMNELSAIFKKMNINTYDVLEAAGTKWNFLKFVPGLVGGHCIGVDPYYLTYKAAELGYHSKVILSGRQINDGMGAQIAKQVIQELIKSDKALKQCKVLVMGTTFKENVSDIRNSKVVDVINELNSFMLNVDVIDPFADSSEVEYEYGYSLVNKPSNDYDAIILAVNHKQYSVMTEADFKAMTRDDALFFDVKGVFRNKITKLKYMSL